MKRYLGISFVTFCSCLLLAGIVLAKPIGIQHSAATQANEQQDVIGDVDGTAPAAGKVLADTVWIADWTFDNGAPCNESGWVKYDNRILNDGSNYWVVDNRFAGTGGIVSKAAILSRHTLTWPTDGYGNNWDYSIILKYKGAGSTLSFKYLSDSEPGFDFVTVEADSAGASESRVNYGTNPKALPEDFRSSLITAVSGLVNNGSVASLALPDFGVPLTTHEAYIRFEADGGYSDEDGNYPTFWQAGLIVDGISVTGGLAYSENFEGALNANVTLANTAPATPFGEWARLFQHVTDNDKCTENTTCAWLWSDPLRIAFFPDRAFGPGSAIVRNWLDDIIVSPWASLASTPTATGTALSYRRFGGQLYAQARIAQNYRVRAKVRLDNTDTSAPGDSIDAISVWGHASSWTLMNTFSWGTVLADLTPDFPATGSEIQVSFRVSDWQYIAGVPAPVTLNPGPGPYIDRVRLGRRILLGPVIDIGIDTRFNAQDAFPTVLGPSTPGEHYVKDPGGDRFGTCAFSEGTELGINSPGSPNLITGDSIALNNVLDARGAGGINSVKLYGAIVAGPHAGKSPIAPFTVGTNGFWSVNADSTRGPGGSVILGGWQTDLDDTYFRGGDQLLYFWAATDVAGGFTSFPPGLTGVPTGTPPASITNAENATNGLMEVSYLPTINWAPAYRARIVADPNGGDLAPTAGELAASTQKNCLLYYQHVTSARRSGAAQRTSFMYTLDRLGYAGYYDVYDLQGFGNTNNQLGGRATEAACGAYALIIQDDGRSGLTLNIPDGSNVDGAKINQSQWYRNYLDAGATSFAGTASLWSIGENTVFENSGNALFTTYMGLTGVITDQGLNVNPDVEGVAAFTLGERQQHLVRRRQVRLERWLPGHPCLRRGERDGYGSPDALVQVGRDDGPRRDHHEQERREQVEHRVAGLPVVRHASCCRRHSGFAG
jgi:hypothetical protein